jgi:hypothetical protein
VSAVLCMAQRLFQLNVILIQYRFVLCLSLITSSRSFCRNPRPPTISLKVSLNSSTLQRVTIKTIVYFLNCHSIDSHLDLNPVQNGDRQDHHKTGGGSESSQISVWRPFWVILRTKVKIIND